MFLKKTIKPCKLYNAGNTNTLLYDQFRRKPVWGNVHGVGEYGEGGGWDKGAVWVSNLETCIKWQIKNLVS